MVATEAIAEREWNRVWRMDEPEMSKSGPVDGLWRCTSRTLCSAKIEKSVFPIII
jgi:hypothetical protein